MGVLRELWVHRGTVETKALRCRSQSGCETSAVALLSRLFEGLDIKVWTILSPCFLMHLY